jgi:uncharacterized repeat protein (TIGR02543 family)
MSKIGWALRILLVAVLSATPLVALQAPAQAAGAACPTTNYLPDTNTYPNNYTFKLIPEGYLLSNNIYYKVNKSSGEAIAVGYDRSFTGALTVPENLTITATEIQASGFDSATPNCSAFAKTYKVRYIGPDAFSAEYGSTQPVLSAINIEAEIKVVGLQAFVAQCKIETLVIPDSVTDIGKTAFGNMNNSGLNNSNCGPTDGLKSVTLGINFKRFYDTAFNQSQRLTSLVLRGQPLSSTPGDFPAEYDLWGSNRNSLVGTMDNRCLINFTYVSNLTVRMLVNTKNDWTPWARADNCFSLEQVSVFTEDVTTPPSKPEAPVASNPTQSTADVTFTAPTSDGGSAITSYVVTSVPGGFSATSSGAAGGTVTVAGLDAATAYKFEVVAINANGTSTQSELSNEVTTLALTAPNITLSSISEFATAGFAINGYTITNTGGPVASYSISPQVSNGLSFNTNTGALTGTPAAAAAAEGYTITATNAVGTSTATFTITVVTPVPTLISVSPNTGITTGGTAITITGANFAAGATVTVGGSACTSVVVVSATSITCVTPAGVAGLKDVSVTNTDSGTVTSPAFTYNTPVVISSPTITSVSPSSGTTAGGTAITITGSGFVAGATVTVGGTACTSVVVVSATSITCVTPAGTSGAKDVVVTNTDTGTATSAASFTYAKPFRAVTFKANGGTGTLANSSKNVTSALPANTFVRTGYVFKGWNTNAKGTGVAYANKSSYSFSADLTLYAQWTAIQTGSKLKKNISIFAGDKDVLTAKMKSEISTWVKKLPKNANITCLGSTQGDKVTAFDTRLATSRALNVCAAVVKVRSDVKYTIKVNPSSSTKASARNVWIYQK